MKEREAQERIARDLLAKGKSMRHISRALGIHRDTVKRRIGMIPPKKGVSEQRKEEEKKSKLDGFRRRIEELLKEKDMTVEIIFRTIRREGYTGGKTILGDWVRKLRGKRGIRKAFARYEPPPAYDYTELRVELNRFAVVGAGVETGE